jgi:hypothetical protein
MEKLVHEYLNSIVGDNTTLTVSKQSTHLMKGLKMFQYLYIINGIKVGSRPLGVRRITMKSELYHNVRKLFGLSHTDTSLYFNRWLNKIPVDGE